VESAAGFIGDPVSRLRFLRTVAPLAGVDGGKRRAWSRSGRLALAVLAAVAVLISLFLTRAVARVAPAPPPRATSYRPPEKPRPSSAVWQVESSGGFDVYSNGLRIDSTFAVSNHPRSYLAFPAAGTGGPVKRTEPAGIVFHSTESQQAPFEAGNNEEIKKIGESLLEYIRRRRSYHFLIDRFGRVYRVVAEGDAANHAGYSVWADGGSLYINLNESFFGIAFEAATGGARAEPKTTSAQTRSAVMLAEMLRARYRIPAGNCVTHAQVSVNPSNMLVGYHVDWAADFPFEDLGLPNNYSAALPSIWKFGFEWDPTFAKAASGAMWAGVESAARMFDQRAAESGDGPRAYRKRLRDEYRQKLAAVGSSDKR
jgi:hypothetical protein